MAVINIRKSIIVFVASTVLLANAFYADPLGMIENDFSVYWREVSEFFVIGRLVKSQQDGILSGGGLLVIGDANDYDVTNKTIKHQYDAYSRGERFDTYWTYKSTPALEGVIYSIFDKFTSFKPGQNIKLFRASVSLFSAAVVALLLAWIEIELGFLAFLLTFLYAYASPWLILFGGHIYWQMWSFFLPFVTLLWLSEYSNRNRPASLKLYALVAFVAVFLKTLVTGFEFITSVLVSVTIPGVYYSIKNQCSLKDFLRMFLHVSFGGLLATVSGLLVLFLQITNELGNFASSYKSIDYALNRRAIGDPAKFSGVFADALKANQWDVIRKYVLGPSLAFDGRFTGGIYSGGVRFSSIILLVLFFSLLLILLIVKSRASEDKRKSLAILITTWYSSLAALSWFVIFKAHASIHINLDYFVWQAPFLLLGFALIGWSIKQSIVVYNQSRARRSSLDQSALGDR